jgi:phosphonate transport system substrate-binding protein
MTKIIKTLLYSFALFFVSLAHTAEVTKQLSLGLFPYVTPAQLVQFHSPLKNYLSKILDIEVNLVTAPDFESFMQRTQKGEYDIIFTAPHLGRLAEKRDGYKSIAMTEHHVEGIFLARKDSAINSLDDLKDKKVMVAQRISLIFQMVQYTLAQKGLTDGKNITIIETKTHNNALYAPLRDEADASVTGIILWETLGQEYKDKLKVIGTTDSVPGFVIMVHPRVPMKIQKKLQNAIFDFKNTSEGKTYFEHTHLNGFQAVDSKIMKQLDPYTKIFAGKP